MYHIVCCLLIDNDFAPIHSHLEPISMLSDGLRSLSAIVTARIYKPCVARFVREKGGRVKKGIQR